MRRKLPADFFMVGRSRSSYAAQLDTPSDRFHIGLHMVVQAEQDEIPFADFPELDKLCWNEHGRSISGADAYRLYVRNWDFVRRAPLEARELALVQSLNEHFGGWLDV
jgi:hypothetical protein